MLSCKKQRGSAIKCGIAGGLSIQQQQQQRLHHTHPPTITSRVLDSNHACKRPIVIAPSNLQAYGRKAKACAECVKLTLD